MSARGSIDIADIERILWEIQDQLAASRKGKRGAECDTILFAEETVDAVYEALLGKPMDDRPQTNGDQS